MGFNRITVVVDLVNTLVLNLGTSCVITCFLQLEKSWNGVKVKGLVLQGRLLETFQIAELLGLSNLEKSPDGQDFIQT